MAKSKREEESQNIMDIKLQTSLDKKLDCGIYNGVSQYGKITIMSDGSNDVQCHIHDFNENIYGKKLDIKNIKKLHNQYKSKNDHCNLAKNILQNNI